MSDQARQELALRAGVDPEYVDRLVDLGILHLGSDGSYARGDARRARWVRGLEQAGIPLDGMAAAVREGSVSFSFVDAPAFAKFADESGTTFADLSAKTGIPMDLLKVVREAIGFAEPRPDDHVRDDELTIVAEIEFQLAHGFPPSVCERWLRVCADNLRRIVETETEWWRTEVVQPLLAGGMSEREMLDTQAQIGSDMAPLLDSAVMAMYHGQQEHAWTKSNVEVVEEAMERAGLLRRLHHPPAVCFLDLTGYTRLTEERGDEAAADLAGRLAALVRRSSQGHGGQAVKWLGDGVMFHFPEPGPSVLAALDMVDGVTNESLPPAHVGIHAGPVVFQDGDYFGRTVNVASRIADYARPGEVLVSQEVVDASEGADVRFTAIGPVELKGVSGALQLHSAHRAS